MGHSAQVLMQGWADSIGSLSGEGEVELSSATLTVGRTTVEPEPPTVYTGVISGTGGLVKTGNTTLALTANNSYSGTTTVEQGTLLVHGTQDDSLITQVMPGGTLGGAGRVEKVNVSGGRLAPRGGSSPVTCRCPGCWTSS
jgi:autotransporter-associated beta strand protein